MPDVFACPTASLKKGETNYMALYAVKCFSNPSKLETNILLVETATGTCWMSPVDVSVEDMPHVCNYHSDGGHIAIDGTVEYVKANEVLSAKRKIQNAE
jgi:predicted homoserine dehydrogenase-like protein